MLRSEKARSRSVWRIARPVLSLALSVGLMLYILSGVDWTVLRRCLRLMSPGYLALAFALLLLNDFFLSFKCFLLRPDLPFWRIYRMFLDMRFFSLMPGGNVASEAARLLTLREMTGTQTAAAIIILDKQTHMIPAQTFCLFSLLFATVPVPRPLVWLALWSLAWPLLMPGALFLPAACAWARKHSHRLRQWKLGGRFARALGEQLALLCDFCQGLARHPRQLRLHLFFGFLGEGCFILTLMLLCGRLGLPVPWWNWPWLSSMMLMAMVIPFSVMGMGVREGAMVLLLSLFGISRSEAMSLPLILSALVLIKGIVGGAIAALDRRFH